MTWPDLTQSLTPAVRAGLPLFAIVLTLGAYLLGVEIQKRLRSPLANPVLLAIVLIGITLRLFHLSYQDYFTGAQFIHFLLGPATVALAIPMVRALEHIRRGFWPLLSALLAGSLIGILSGYGLVRLLGGSQAVALSMAPKSLTTPIAIAVSSSIGGIPSLSAVLAILGGILVAISIDPLLNWLNIHEPSARGLAAGTAGSGIGASRVIPQHTLSAAFAGVAIGANGILTALLAPLLAPLLKHW
ncbi:MAG TPA: LrgB family protein [Acidobacteriaceae bacterium]|jgi:predicted murein hydrolase (TIGR00659 family)|nr:LrgB family protein [Acidobacteriaceae bacterium]